MALSIDIKHLEQIPSVERSYFVDIETDLLENTGYLAFRQKDLNQVQKTHIELEELDMMVVMS
jgi:hypothetical protein